MLDDAPDIKMAMAYGPPPWDLGLEMFPEEESDSYEEQMKEEFFYQSRADEQAAELTAEIEYYSVPQPL